MRRSGSLNTGIFLDRDGVINKAIIRNNLPYSPRERDDFVILEGVRDAISILVRSGIIPVVITNQPDVSRGFTSVELVEQQHSILKNLLGIQHFYICYHDDTKSCNCRKPKIGLLISASQQLNISLERSYLVGDRWKDIQAGQEAGCSCFFVDYQYAEKQPELPFQKVKSLLEAVKMIVKEKNG